jgi:hypothetical protein
VSNIFTMSAHDQSIPNGDQNLNPPQFKSKRQITPRASKKKTQQQTRPHVASDDLPKKTLEDALKVAAAIKTNYGKTGATLDQIAKAMDMSASSTSNKYFVWSATAYGIVTKEAENNYKVTEIGRKILSPTFDGEDREGVIKAIATPSVLARFYSDYSSSTLPQGDIFKNVLEENYGIPKIRVDEAINLILANARYAKLLEEQPDGKLKLLSTNAAVGVGSDSATKLAATAPIGEAAPVTSVTEVSTEYSKACFVITPIGDENSPERKHADAMLRHLITPVLAEFGITPIRADKIDKPGHITKQTVEHIAFCKLCITDISFGNPNAHYELGIRHTLKLPSIQIVRKGDKIPFDIQQGRTIIIDTSDPYTIMDRMVSAKAELSEHVKSLLSSTGKQEESPITMYLQNLSVKIG